MSLVRRLPSSNTLAIAIIVALGAVTAPGTMAQQRDQDRDERPTPQDRTDRSRSEDSRHLSDAVRRFERANRGQVLSAERMQYDGRDVNRIKVLDDEGRVRIYMDEPVPAPRRNNERPPSQRDDD
jgi:hypothetical protein